MIYLDNSATTRTLDEAAAAAMNYMTKEFFNPAAAYSPAVNEERAVNKARANMAKVIKASADELIFTSGGTESNNMALFGTLKGVRESGRIIVSAVEHPSVYSTVYSLSDKYEIVEAPVMNNGSIDTDALSGLITSNTKYVSIMQVNNETGAINDIPAVYALLRKQAPSAFLHVDGVQGFLKCPFDVRYCDLYSVSGHKFHAPKGIGALYVKKGVPFKGGQIGGGQEHNLRSGTTNTPGIMGMDAAISAYAASDGAFIENLRKCKLKLAENLKTLPDVVINGPEPSQGAPHILNASFIGVRGEVLLHALEEKEIYVSTGSACSAHKKGRNRILSAMGITGERQEGAIRFSFCPFNTTEEMDTVSEALKDTLNVLRKFKRR